MLQTCGKPYGNACYAGYAETYDAVCERVTLVTLIITSPVQTNMLKKYCKAVSAHGWGILFQVLRSVVLL